MPAACIAFFFLSVINIELGVSYRLRLYSYVTVVSCLVHMLSFSKMLILSQENCSCHQEARQVMQSVASVTVLGWSCAQHCSNKHRYG